MKTTLSAILCCAAVYTGSAQAEPADTIAAQGPDATWLFIQTADGMKFEGTVLTLTGVDPAMVMFTDRPHRNAEVVPIGCMDQGWRREFPRRPAECRCDRSVHGKFQVSTVELSEPKLDGTTLTFNAKTLEGTVPSAGGQTSVFIDGGCSPWDPRC